MSDLKEKHLPVKIVVNCFYADEKALEEAKTQLVEYLGPIEDEMTPLDFNFTRYYESEMGSDLKKTIFSFERLTEPESLVAIKHFTDALERKIADARGTPENRPVNIDPGQIYLERFLLATGKNVSHRIYIGRGVFADLTLMFIGGHYVRLPWTYVDYLHPKTLAFLEQVREKYRLQLKDVRKQMNEVNESGKE